MEPTGILKRTDFTTEEVKILIKDQKMYHIKDEDDEWCKNNNEKIDNILSEFIEEKIWSTESLVEIFEEKLKNWELGSSDNDHLYNLINMFHDFLRSEDESGAMVYDTGTTFVFHIGPRLPR